MKITIDTSDTLVLNGKRYVLLLEKEGKDVAFKRKNFTPDEAAFIASSYEKQTVPQIAAKLGRTHASVQSYISRHLTKGKS